MNHTNAEMLKGSRILLYRALIGGSPQTSVVVEVASSSRPQISPNQICRLPNVFARILPHKTMRYIKLTVVPERTQHVEWFVSSVNLCILLVATFARDMADYGNEYSGVVCSSLQCAHNHSSAEDVDSRVCQDLGCASDLCWERNGVACKSSVLIRLRLMYS